MKKGMTILLAALLTFSLAACGINTAEDSPEPESTRSESQTSASQTPVSQPEESTPVSGESAEAGSSTDRLVAYILCLISI